MPWMMPKMFLLRKRRRQFLVLHSPPACQTFSKLPSRSLTPVFQSNSNLLFDIGTFWLSYTWDESVFLAKKILHHFRQAFWYGKGVRYHQKKFQNRDIGGFWENVRFVRSNGRKTTFEWPKVISEVSFLTCCGVFRSIKVVSVFRFGDQKCRFRDMAIRTLLCKFMTQDPGCEGRYIPMKGMRCRGRQVFSLKSLIIDISPWM